jgi:nucleotide-binding universal stress UspA family protein
MQNILIGIPAVPDEAEHLAAWAAWYRDQLKAPGRFVLLHVVPVPGQDVAGMMGETIARSAQDGEALLARLREKLGPGFELRMETGDAGAVLVQASRDFDLLVVGTHHRARLREMLLGSTEAYITHHAPCAVMLLCARALEAYHF